MPKHSRGIWIFLATGFMMTAAWGPPARAGSAEQTMFKRIPLQYIAALGDPSANSGTGAQMWGLWSQDPGPRGCRLKDYDQLKATGGIAPARWKFDEQDWWLEEHGVIMEKPVFPLPPGKYVVTGGRDVTAVLTVYTPDQNGTGRWELDKGAQLSEVTHLPCRAARYTPQKSGVSCSPAQAKSAPFPLAPGVPLPAIEGCHKQDYSVLFVIGVAVE